MPANVTPSSRSFGSRAARFAGLVFVAILLQVAAPASAQSVEAGVCPPFAERWDKTTACLSHYPPSGNDIHCDKGWSSFYAADTLLLNVPGVGRVYVYAGYYCLNWSNYGENPVRSSAVTMGVTGAGQQVTVGWIASYDFYYRSDGSGPFYRDDCRVWYWTSGAHKTDYTYLSCAGILPLPAEMVFPLLYANAQVNMDVCKGQTQPAVRVCRGGAPKAWLVGVTLCNSSTFDPTGQAEVRVGTLQPVREPYWPLMGCRVARML